MRAFYTLIFLGLTSIANGQITHDWSQNFGASGEEIHAEMTMDSNKDLILVGRSNAYFDADPGTGTVDMVMTNPGSPNGIVLKMDTTGSTLWGFVLGCAGGSAWVNSVCTDPDNNIYVVGAFQNTMDADPGTGTHTLTSLNAFSSKYNGFVAKYDENRNLIWAFELTSTNSVIPKVIRYNDGHVYVGGEFDWQSEFDPAGGTATLSPVNGNDGFMGKYKADDGEFVWLEPFGGNGSDYLTDLKIDTNGDLLIIGSFYDTVDFDPGVGDSSITSVGFGDAYVLKWDSAATFQWVRTITGANSEYITDAEIDRNGNVYVTGSFSSPTADPDGPGGDVMTRLSNNGLSDEFVVKYDMNGNYQWNVSIKGSAVSYSGSIEVDYSGRVYMQAMSYQITPQVDFDPGTGSAYLVDNGTLMYLAVYDEYGGYDTVYNLGGYAPGEILMNDFSHIFFFNTLQGTSDYDPSAAASDVVSNGDKDLVLSRYAECKAGIIDFSENTLVCSGNDIDLTISANGSGTIQYSWFHNGTPITGNDNDTLQLSNAGSSDAGTYYCVVSNACGTDTSDVITVDLINAFSNVSDVSCFGNTDGSFLAWLEPGNWEYSLDSSSFQQDSLFDNLPAGTYTIYGVLNGAGCNINNITINEPAILAVSGTTSDELMGNDGSVDISVTGGTSPYAYSWTGPGGFTSTSEDLSGLAAGSYIVIVTDANGCEETSVFTVGSQVGINSTAKPIIIVYPNPAHESTVIELIHFNQTTTVLLADLTGKTIATFSVSGSRAELDLSNIESGIYFLRTQQNGQFITQKLVIE